MGSAHGRLRNAAWKGTSTGRSTACVKLRLPLISLGRHGPKPHRHQNVLAIVQCAIVQYMKSACAVCTSEAKRSLACVH